LLDHIVKEEYMNPKTPKPEILECTVRDGNYAVDFKFTATDTALLSGELARLGFDWIEVGHGLGLGGMEAGKGGMPAGDIDLIRAAKKNSGTAKVGMFFIPGIGRLEHLAMAKEAGLDFVRIGYNAPEAETAYPYISRARELGFITCLNLMKSYAVSPGEFALKAKGAVDAGAEILYCVDSAGSMLPDDVARYLDATRDLVKCELGFHGHNNLMMGIANCVRAYEHGARYLDATLCGLGRSAGNAPTEILLAVFERLGIPMGIDLFEVLDTIERYMWPLVSKTRPNDMMGVTAGYLQFHSSHLPQVSAVAKKYHVELRRLLAKVARHDPVAVDDDYLERSAQALQGTGKGCSSEALMSFSVPEISRERINSSMQSVKALVDGLVVSSAKRTGTRTVLHLVPSDEPAEDLVLPEFVLSDDQMVMGRVIFGSFDRLGEIIAMTQPHIAMYLVNQVSGWAREVPEAVARIVGPQLTLPVRDAYLRQVYLLEVLDRASQRFGHDAILLYGQNPMIMQALEAGTRFDTVFIWGLQQQPVELPDRSVILDNRDDWRNMQLKFNVVLCGANPAQEDARILLNSLTLNGKLVSIIPLPDRELVESAGDRWIQVDLNLAYSGIIERYFKTENAFASIAMRQKDYAAKLSTRSCPAGL
jgi:4-hydroxy-2-oxovalerate aldolase